MYFFYLTWSFLQVFSHEVTCSFSMVYIMEYNMNGDVITWHVYHEWGVDLTNVAIKTVPVKTKCPLRMKSWSCRNELLISTYRTGFETRSGSSLFEAKKLQSNAIQLKPSYPLLALIIWWAWNCFQDFRTVHWHQTLAQRNGSSQRDSVTLPP